MRIAILFSLLGLFCGRSALAANCADLPSPVYVTGSTAARPLLVEISRYLSSQTPPITVVYLGQGSCAGVDAILNATPLKGEGAFSTWDSTGGEARCDVPESGPVF